MDRVKLTGFFLLLSDVSQKTHTQKKHLYIICSVYLVHRMGGSIIKERITCSIQVQSVWCIVASPRGRRKEEKKEKRENIHRSSKVDDDRSVTCCKVNC